MSFGGILKQSTAVDVLIGPFVDSADGDSEEIGLTIAQADVRLSKNGQTAAQKSDITSCAHDADGFYNCELDATDTDTVGQLTLYVHVAGALAVRHDYHVVEEVIYDAIYGASATGLLPANVTQFGGSNGTFASGRPEVNTTHLDGTSGAGNAAADALLKRDWTSVTGEAARSVLNALRFLRNKWSVAGGTLTVTKEDDTASAWTAAVTSDAAAEPIIGNDPS